MNTTLLRSIQKNIFVASVNDPLKPEFPYQSPRFPATETFKIDVPGFTNVWLKDESQNPTGTHKDRMAWEIVVTYKFFIDSVLEGRIPDLPHMSIISSGSAAYAIQTAFANFGLPYLKVLVDSKISQSKIEVLKKIGCEVYVEDLEKKTLTSEEILELTNNLNGFDITSLEGLDPGSRFYDWLSYEIINNDPEYVFVPFGTGNLFENILSILKFEKNSESSDPRLVVSKKKINSCNIVGATTHNPQSKIAEKLYSTFLPFTHYSKDWLRFYKEVGYCGNETCVCDVSDEYVDKAVIIAQENKLSFEPSGIAGLALLLQMKDSIPPDSKIVIVNTGKTKFI